MPIDATQPYDDQNIFAKILRGEIPNKTVYEDEWALAFHDINPQAPVHVLVIPASHYGTVGDLATYDSDLLADVLARATALTAELGLDEGYRLVANTGRDGGQTVDHVHVHVMGGRHLTWPPG